LNNRTVKCTVEGRVQGVFFRAATAERASELGIRGWVRNTANGCVEVVASGDAEPVEAFVAWLWRGPSRAEVTAVAVEEWTGDVDSDFRIVRL
jgi:acylphosphatase